MGKAVWTCDWESRRQKTGWKTKKDMVRECRSGYGITEIDRKDVHDRKKWRGMLRNGSPTLSENEL